MLYTTELLVFNEIQVIFVYHQKDNIKKNEQNIIL